MVFPSLVFNFEPGIVSQAGAMAVITFSYLLHRFKKIMAVLIIAFAILMMLQSKVWAFAYTPSYNHNTCPGYSQCSNNQNYYGRPWGYNPSAYFYPQLRFHGMWGGGYQPSYFYPHTPSPYSPYPSCPYCNQQYFQQQQQQQFPMPYIHPDGAAS